ncbi:N-acetylneuraminate lyase [Rhodoferax koreense]|uniref:N-acetylneuraminate lyase n=1 Tax=Rhodoferax koreensis TaxID=1842727 RepID=A0A1P8K200_9BURK|nr:N-acetylneuraminate lyase [Rhodoferax koreense]APW40025.1 N-acetylneuraminate lyase [Rhodoferax koreense]
MSETQRPAHALGGVYSALITPFHADGRLNLDQLAPLAEFELAQGLHGFYVGGSTGEAFLQTADERVAVLKAFARAVQGRARLIAHVGAIATDEAIHLAHAAADAGYDAISAIPPFYYDFSAAEVLAHYQALADATPLPLVVYNFPAKSARPLSTADLLTLLAHPKIIGVKHTSQNLYQLERLKTAAPDAVIYNGFDEMFAGGMAMGADGGIGTTFNVMGRIFVEMYEALRRGDLPRAQRLQTRANAVIDVLIDIGVFPGTKAMLKLLGQDCGPCRRPFATLSASQMAKVEHVVATHLR